MKMFFAIRPMEAETMNQVGDLRLCGAKGSSARYEGRLVNGHV